LGVPTIDRFATYANKLLDRFNSYFLEPFTEGVDAFAQHNWEYEYNYCNPPFALLGRLTNFLIYEVPNAQCLCIIPFWTGTPWFEQLAIHATHMFLLP
jgi:hypothetical protein